MDQLNTIFASIQLYTFITFISMKSILSHAA